MTDNPYLRRRKGIGITGVKSEKRVAKKIQGRQHAGSGNMVGYKGDITKDSFLLECKSTVHESFQLTREILAKITAEASMQGKLPALTISFITGNGKAKEYGDWVCIPLKDFEDYKQFKEDEIR